VVQIVAVDNTHSQLVTCGSVFQGSCQSRSLFNISLYEVKAMPEDRFVASTDPTNHAVAFVAPGPSSTTRLYVGTDDVVPSLGIFFVRKYTCGVSSRDLSGDNIFQIAASGNLGTFAHLSKEAAISSDFLMKYVAGFSVEEFSYFLTTQPAVYPSNSLTPRVSKLSQVCQQDEDFDSYVEMRISCRSDSKDYNLVQAATFLKPGSKLASRLNLPASEYLLLAAFYGEPDTAMCIYRLSDIRARFTDNIRACFNSSSLRVGSQFHDSTRHCTTDSKVGQLTISSFVSFTK